MLPKIIIAIVVILALFLVAGSFFRKDKQSFSTNKPAHITEESKQQDNEQATPNLGEGINKPFYSQDGIFLTHAWPGEGNFSNEETEILLFNESSTNVEVKSFDLVYTVEGKTYPHKSGTWEKFPTKVSWNKIEYLNISPQYYKGEQLLLTPSQKGKLHWHIQFGSNPLNGRQTIKLKLTLLINSKTIVIDEQFNRDSGTVFSKSEH